MLRVGMLTSGGDCQALNATMRGVAKTLYQSKEKVEIYGFLEGYRGLMYGNFRKMKPQDFSGILTIGGTILGTSRTPFKLITHADQLSHTLLQGEAVIHRVHPTGFRVLGLDLPKSHQQ